MNTNVGDLVGFFGILAVFFFGVSQDTANQVGAWIALLAASLCGSLIALGLADSKPWGALQMVWFVFIRVFASMMLAMSIVKVIAMYFPAFGPGIVLAPVAFFITCDPLRAWALSLLDKLVASRLKKRL